MSFLSFSPKKLSVLMPVHNESRTLRTIVGRVLASPVDLEIKLVCVDDRSSNDSLALSKILPHRRFASKSQPSQ